MSTEDNKALVRYWIEEVINKGNLAVVDALCPPGYVGHNPHHPLKDQPVGPEEVKEHVVKWLHAVFPDLHQDIEEMIAEGDKVVVRWTNSGTHVGEFMGIPPTGKSFSIAGIDIHRLSGGKMAEHWHVVDLFGQLQQLGLIPQPA